MHSTELPPVRSPRFATTQWTLVAELGAAAPERRRRAWDAVARNYWFPIYAFIRSRGHGVQDAEDLTQEFLARAIDKDYLAGAERERGRFRTYLRVLLDRFLCNAHDRRTARKRGGPEGILSLEGMSAEERFAAEPAEVVSPETLFERKWALAVWEQALARLRDDYRAAGRAGEFDMLKGSLSAPLGGTDYRALAVALGGSEGAARVAVHRLRKRLREVFHAVVAETVPAGEDVDAEVRHLVHLLGTR